MKSVHVGCCYVIVYLLRDVSSYWDRLHSNYPFRVQHIMQLFLQMLSILHLR